MLILFYFLIITNYERKKSEILMILNQFEFQIKNEPIKLFIIFIFILFLLNIFYFYTEKNNNRSGYHIII